jgi:tetratricopeptide (TPR) repeat protein
VTRRRPSAGGGLAPATVLAITVALALLGERGAAGETVDEAYARALKDHYAGRYAAAASAFERILAVPVENEDLHYNLGCAYFRLGRLGPAIYHFERALALDPSAEDARFNLEASRTLVSSRVKDELRGAADEPWWVRVVAPLRPGLFTVLFLALWWVTFGILVALRYVQPGPARSGLVAGSALAGLLALVCGLLLAGRVYLGEAVPRGIVLSEKLEVREGPDPATKTSFRVHAGLKVRLSGGEAGWVRIRLANGLEGWVPSREIGTL